jgi:hypothetical protein
LQPQVFEQLGLPIVEPVLSGISGTVFAYGVTSSGKTHTMMGPAADGGLVPRCITSLFNSIEQQSSRWGPTRISAYLTRYRPPPTVWNCFAAGDVADNSVAPILQGQSVGIDAIAAGVHDVPGLRR